MQNADGKPHTHGILAAVIGGVSGPPGWSFRLQVSPPDLYPKLVIRVEGRDSAEANVGRPPRRFTVDHFFPVPEATYNEASWRRWVFERCRGVMNHELGEWMRWGAERPFAPLHGPGEDPYTVHEYRPVADALTTQDGSPREPYA